MAMRDIAIGFWDDSIQYLDYSQYDAQSGLHSRSAITGWQAQQQPSAQAPSYEDLMYAGMQAAAAMAAAPTDSWQSPHGQHHYQALVDACDNAPASDKGGHEKQAAVQNRHIFTDDQGLHLEAVFALEKCPSKDKCKELAKDLNIPVTSIANWFKNRRRRPSKFHTVRASEGDFEKRRERTSFTPSQLEHMSALFESNQHPEKEEMEKLADKIKLKPATVKLWFKNRRSALKKKNPTK